MSGPGPITNRPTSARRRAIAVAHGMLLVGLLAGLAAALASFARWESTGILMGAAASTVLGAVLALGVVHTAGRRRFGVLAVVGFAASLAVVVLGTLAFAGAGDPGADPRLRSAGQALVLALAIIIPAARPSAVGRGLAVAALRWITLAATLIAAAGLLYVLAVGPWLPLVLPVAGLRGIAIVLGAATVLAPVSLGVSALLVRRARRLVARDQTSLGRAARIELACPSCAAEQTVRPGLRRCGDCGCGFTLKIEEPRCDCGYVLFRISTEQCPECGRAIDAEHRWVEVASPESPARPAPAG